MCHASVHSWAASAFTSEMVAGKAVVEVGSYNVNGSVRDAICALGPTSYLGVDIQDGPGVDLVADVADLPARFPEGFDVVVTTEMLEHVESWKVAIKALVRLVAPGGVLAITTRSLGFPLHEYPRDTWRYSPDEMRAILAGAGMDVTSSVPDPQQPGVFALAAKPADWKAPRRKDWWPDVTLPIWDGSIPEDQ